MTPAPPTPRPRSHAALRRRIAYAVNNVVAARPWAIAVAVLAIVLLLSALLAILLTLLEQRVRSGGAAS